MKEYQKIETIYERDIQGTKKLILGKFRDPLVDYLKDLPWICTEKVDGTNIRVHWDGHKFNFYGRTDNANIPTFLYAKLEEIFRNNETEQVVEQLFNEREVILVGEGYGNKIQKCGSNYIQNGVDFIGFDVMVKSKELDRWYYLSRENAEGIYKALNIKMVPIVLKASLQEAVNFVISKPKSQVSEVEQIMEGLVCTPEFPIYDNQGHRIIVKIKVKDLC